MRWANRRTLQCSSRRSLDAAIDSSLRSMAPLASSGIEIAPAPERSKSFFLTHRIAIACLSPIVIAVIGVGAVAASIAAHGGH